MTETQVHQDEEVREIAQADTSLAVARSRVELDQQVATARAYPRSIKRFLSECMDMATLNEQVAGECIYALPARKGGDDNKAISGPSARLAEIVASAWGNCRAGARVVDEGAEFITAQGMFQDLERNVHVTMEVRRRITGRNGRRYSADMIGVTGNAACSIALRNAVFKGVPKAFWSGVYQAARQAALGKGTLEEKRSSAIKYAWDKFKVKPEQVFAALGVAGAEDLGLDELANLKGMYHAINEGEITATEAFAPREEAPPPASAAEKKGVAGLAERVAAAKGAASSAQAAEPKESTGGDGGGQP